MLTNSTASGKMIIQRKNVIQQISHIERQHALPSIDALLFANIHKIDILLLGY